MSVNLLNHATRPVMIADELESFFHVLVYYAVRYLRSNCTSVDSWINDYFHSYSGPGHMFTCGRKSVTVQMTGMLEIRSLEGPLVFRSPMDNVLVPIVKSLAAHYKVMAYESAKAIPPAPRRATPPQSPPISVPPRIIRKPKLDEDKLDPDQVARWEASLEAPPVDDFTPTAQDRELAKKVADHSFMLGHLERALENPWWQGNDRISGTESSEALDAKGKMSEDIALRNAKRQRITGPEQIASLPGRLHPSAVRTRTRARTHPLRSRR